MRRCILSKKPLTGFFACASTAEHFVWNKMLYLKSLDQGFSDGSLLYSRRALPPRAPLLLYCLPVEHRFYPDSQRRTAKGDAPLL